MTGEEILQDRIGAQKEEFVAPAARIAPWPLFAEGSELADTVVYVQHPPEPDRGGTVTGSYALRADRVGAGTLLDLPLPGRPRDQGDYSPFSPAFVLNGRAVLVSRPSGDAYWSKLPAAAGPDLAPERTRLATISVAALAPVKRPSGPDLAALKPAEAYTPWHYAPVAAVQLSNTLRFAWLSDAGIWVADATPAANRSVNAARAPGVSAPLLVGEPGGSRLRFSRSGEFLLLQQQPHYGGPIQVRVWNLSPRWRQHIAEAGDEALLNMACSALTRHQQDLKDAQALGLFKLKGTSMHRCMQGR
jgi:hypothetical protein